ncbi:MAG: CHASE2 domain-containing protein [Proteobacteria bacterium]|nr:CHASE2 domain-containing protein [Pseudomonadota bacterium]MBU1708396.1 CHASE2 domain-containing protein [Pseudomonadota bacterium]
MNIFKKYPTIISGAGITLLFLLLGLVHLEVIDSLELKLYDLRMHLLSDQDSPSEIVLVNIDDYSIENLGRWPWPRSHIAKGIESINAGNPKAIGLNIIFSEPEENTGLIALKRVEEILEESGLAKTENGKNVIKEMDKLYLALDNDSLLADSIKAAGNVILPMAMLESDIEGVDTGEADDSLLSMSITNMKILENSSSPQATNLLLPIKPLMLAANGLGHLTLAYDMDGKVRMEKTIYEFREQFYPSYALRLTAAYLNVPLEEISVELGSSIQLGSRRVSTTLDSDFPVTFKGSSGAFRSYSFFDVYTGKIPESAFKNKLVLIGPSALGLINPLNTPLEPNMPLGELSANVIWSMLNNKTINSPAWDQAFELLLILLVGLIITIVLPRLKARLSALVFFGLMVLFLGGTTYAFAANGLWIHTAYPLLELIFGYFVVISLKYFFTETDKEKVEGESAETNRMLGLSFQGQGMLDMAFDKFRKCPVDQGMQEVLYNLALDYERKRQFNKAASVYEYIEKHGGEFKDADDRKKKMVQLGDTVIMGTGGADPLLSNIGGDGDTKPTLGRYEIIKQLGKGAMGIVYLGKDPRINRTTAIKTFRFADELESDEIAEMKKMFFLEAESAGTLSHPNIVTIYDAGEEEDLAYIAMEYLVGNDLKGNTKKGSLLPMRKVVGYMADLADALDYAHRQGIIHRDIKPANIMLLDNGVVKITDFGIARITSSSKTQTQTGIVKGTPFYMSPEQISGEKVDGRSDLFAMGVVMYQLFTGEVPFRAENFATLMHKIINEPHIDPRKHNPDIPKPLAQIINFALVKDKTKRYQKASQMADHLNKVLRWMDKTANGTQTAERSSS